MSLMSGHLRVQPPPASRIHPSTPSSAPPHPATSRPSSHSTSAAPPVAAALESDEEHQYRDHSGRTAARPSEAIATRSGRVAARPSEAIDLIEPEIERYVYKARGSLVISQSSKWKRRK